MPIYEYTCQACGHELEALQKMSDPVLTECPSCGKPALMKRISAAGFVLKGGGWYATDFRGQGKKQDESKEAVKDDAPKPAAGCGSGACEACTE